MCSNRNIYTFFSFLKGVLHIVNNWKVAGKSCRKSVFEFKAVLRFSEYQESDRKNLSKSTLALKLWQHFGSLKIFVVYLQKLNILNTLL